LFWIDRTKAASAGVALAIACTAGAAMASPLVVKSSGPSAAAYPPGKAIANTAKIALKAGDMVVILDGRGTRTLKGPGLFSPTAASTELADSRDTIDITHRGGQARIGAVRGLEGLSDSRRNPNIWFVDIARSSNVCVTDPARLTMWRGGADDAAVVTLSGPDGKSEQVSWAKGQSLKPWPADMPVTSGAEYRVAWAGAGATSTLRFMILGPNPSGIEDTASLLIKNNCSAQLDLLIETVGTPGPDNTTAG
jgi:hypothetical protein